MNTTKYRKKEYETIQPQESATAYKTMAIPKTRHTTPKAGPQIKKLPDIVPDASAVDYSMGKQAAARSFSYNGTKPTYASPYSQQIDRLFNEIRNTPEFTYDPDTDETYLALEKQYRNLGQRAMQNTSSRIAAQTGGIASSYAASAGAQAFNQYMSELSGFVPELQQLAYEMYQGDMSKKYKELEALKDMDSEAYGRYLDDLEQQNYLKELAYKKTLDDREQQNYEKEFAYRQEQDRVAQNNYLTELEYRLFLDELEQLNYEKEFDYRKEQDYVEQQNYNREFNYNKYLDEVAQQNYKDEKRYDLVTDELDRAWDEALAKAQYGDYSGLLDLGFDLSVGESGEISSDIASGGSSADNSKVNIYSDKFLDKYVTDFISSDYDGSAYNKPQTVDFDTAKNRAYAAMVDGSITAVQYREIIGMLKALYSGYLN